MFRGCGTALITPFLADGELDELTLRKLVRRQIDLGIDFLVPCGTTGESPTITLEEHLRVVKITVEEAAGKVPVLAGAGGYFTREVIELAEGCRAMGADGILSVTPYYNKPSPEGIYQHYKALAEAVPLPIIVYNVKGRTGLNVETGTLARLATLKNIVGVKEASGNIAQMANVVHELPEGFTILSGDDSITIALMGLGGHGLISVASNEIPAEMTAIVRHCREGDFVAARKIQRKYLPLMNVNFVESNPGPVKTAMAMMGLCEPVWRLPMVAPGAASQARIAAVLTECGLLKEQVQHATR
ncbi:MAG: 4-hydroxy-tetrahydrodipicolinate synthase [Bryobacteraceae bacterium]|nr:4-hydroxy-tetrahydrodipicolinate synthase [Bryobacteraceae bacterium]